MRSRSPIVRPAGSREFVDDALAELAAGQWSVSSWLRFSWRCCLRSTGEAAAHRRAFVELTLLHLAFMHRGVRPWPLVAWFLAVTHLGMLGDGKRGAMGANHLSLIRANLPGLSETEAPWMASVALITDFLDGRLARARNEETAFGAYADPLADLVFWTWYVFRHEGNPWIRVAAVTAWPLPAAIITASYFWRGRTLDYPRLDIARALSGMFQGWLAFRAWQRWYRGEKTCQAR